MSDIHPVTCPFCSLGCNDLQVSFEGGILVSFSPVCPLGESGFRRAASSLKTGQATENFLKNSLKTTRRWLQEANQPLVVLSGTLDEDAVHSAVRLAKKYSAILACDEDWSGSMLDLSIQVAGSMTTTLHDLRGLSPVVFWGVDPAHTHPRLYDFLNGSLAGDFLYLNPPDPLEAVRWLRLACLGEANNIPAEITEAADQIIAAQSGLVIFGPGFLKFGQPFVTEFFLWLKDLTREKRWYSLYLAPSPNSTGVRETLLSLTGYPGNLRCSKGQVDYSPRLWRAERVIRQGEADLFLLAGQPASFSHETLAMLSQRRTILLDPDPPSWNPTIWFPTARVGVEVPGHFQRLDGVSVDLDSIFPREHPLMKDLLLGLTAEEPLA